MCFFLCLLVCVSAVVVVGWCSMEYFLERKTLSLQNYEKHFVCPVRVDESKIIFFSSPNETDGKKKKWDWKKSLVIQFVRQKDQCVFFPSLSFIISF